MCRLGSPNPRLISFYAGSVGRDHQNTANPSPIRGIPSWRAIVNEKWRAGYQGRQRARFGRERSGSAAGHARFDGRSGPFGREVLSVTAAGSFLHGLLTFDELFAAGGLRVTDHSTGVTFLPGCCGGLEDRRDWYRLADHGGLLGFGHDPVSPVAERFGGTVRLTVDAERSDSPVIELRVSELRRLPAGVERDLAGFLVLADVWATRYPPGHRAPVTAALACVLGLPSPNS